MKRRELITLLGGAVATWPLVARAQQPAMPVVGFLDDGSPIGVNESLAGFRLGLGEMGYVEGQNLEIEYRWARGQLHQLPAFATDLINRKVAVIVTTRNSACARAAKAATSVIPIVFQTGGDPVADGLVASLNRPGGNVTGVTRLSGLLAPKRLSLLVELVPKATLIALVVYPSGTATELLVKNLEEPARSLGLQLYVVNVNTETELSTAFTNIVKKGASALIVPSTSLFVDQRDRIVALAAEHSLPTMYSERDSVIAGGLISYSANLADSFRQAGVYVGRVLKGAQPAELPVLQPTKFELIINLKTAKALGLTVPPTLLAQADEVIE